MGSLKCCAILLALSGLGQQAATAETVLLDFTADWCGPCQTMRPTIERLRNEGHQVRIVNIDRDPKLAAKYGVTTIPCFVAVTNGREVSRQVGATSYAHLVSMLGRPDQRAATSNNAQASQDPFLGQSGQGPAGQSLAGLPPTSRGAYPVHPTAAHAAAGPQSTRGATEIAAPSELSAKLVAATVRIRVEDTNGHSYGTGTMIDSRKGEVLILTCGHLFRDSAGKGAVTVDFLRDGRPAKASAQLISFDLKRDLGLLSMREAGRVALAPLAPAERSIARGDWVMNVGCNNGEAPTPRSSRVTSIDKYLGPANLEVAGAPVEGRSGGGLFNQQGELIGVCFAADPADNEGVYAALKSIHSEMARLGLSDVAQVGPTKPVPQRLAGNQPPPVPTEMPEEFPTNPSGVRSITLDVPERDLPVQLAAGVDEQAGPASFADLTAAERATLDEIATRSRDAEVICVIRPLNDPEAKSEIIVLDRASPEFLRQLTQRKRISDSRQLTSHDSAPEPARSADNSAQRSVYGSRIPGQDLPKRGESQYPLRR